MTSIYSVFPPPEPAGPPEEEWDGEPTMAEILAEFDDGGGDA